MKAIRKVTRNPEQSEALQSLYANIRLRKRIRGQDWKMAAAVGGNRFILIAKPKGCTPCATHKQVVETEPENAAFRKPGETVLQAYKRRMAACGRAIKTTKEEAQQQFKQLFGRE